MSGETPNFKQTEDLLPWLSKTAAEGFEVRRMPDQQLAINAPALARSLLANQHEAIVQHSDFFGPRERAFSPRSAQIDLVRSCMHLIQQHADTIDSGRSAAQIPERSEWPRTANRLMLELMRPVLAASVRSRGLHLALDRLVTERIVNRYATPKGRLGRMIDRFRYANIVLKEAEAPAPDSGRDILHILSEPERGLSPDSIIHLYTAFVFGLVSSIGLTLAWTILLAVRHQATKQPARNLVREAMRLYPVAWLLERQLHEPALVAGEQVVPPDVLIISPFTVHRCPASWPDPEEFRPERWSQRVDHRAWIPFGAGPQSCAAASFSLRILTDLVTAILDRPASVDMIDDHPSLGPALAPPRFNIRRG